MCMIEMRYKGGSVNVKKISKNCELIRVAANRQCSNYIKKTELQKRQKNKGKR